MYNLWAINTTYKIEYALTESSWKGIASFLGAIWHDHHPRQSRNLSSTNGHRGERIVSRMKSSSDQIPTLECYPSESLYAVWDDDWCYNTSDDDQQTRHIGHSLTVSYRSEMYAFDVRIIGHIRQLIVFTRAWPRKHACPILADGRLIKWPIKID